MNRSRWTVSLEVGHGSYHSCGRDGFGLVQQDIAFIGISRDTIRQLSPALIPLIAHDRAGFGGGLLSTGLLLLMMMRHAPVTRSLVEVIALMGLCGFGAALGVHFAVGYTDSFHLSPAYAGCLLFAIGAALLAAQGQHSTFR
jgi:hypothetical protein